MRPRYRFFPEGDACPPRLPSSRRLALALLVVVWTVALLAMLLYPSLRR
jgi:hypothetical protein